MRLRFVAGRVDGVWGGLSLVGDPKEARPCLGKGREKDTDTHSVGCSTSTSGATATRKRLKVDTADRWTSASLWDRAALCKGRATPNANK